MKLSFALEAAVTKSDIIISYVHSNKRNET